MQGILPRFDERIRNRFLFEYTGNQFVHEIYPFLPGKSIMIQILCAPLLHAIYVQISPEMTDSRIYPDSGR